MKICARFDKRNAKISNVKKLKPFHYHWNFCKNLFPNPRGGSLALEAEETKNGIENFQKNLKKLQVLSKISKFWVIKKFKTIPWPMKKMQ